MVERASVIYGATDVELRTRCRNAPDFVRANIDARREERGLPPLWPSLRRRSPASRAGLHRRVQVLKALLVAYGHRG